MLAGLIHDIGTPPTLMKADEKPDLLKNTVLLGEVLSSLHPRVGEAILRNWEFPETLIAVAAEHENLNRNSANGPDLVDIVQVANLQPYMNTEKALISQNEIRAF
jgi:HD-like signal output (HDOD) protein